MGGPRTAAAHDLRETVVEVVDLVQSDEPTLLSCLTSSISCSNPFPGASKLAQKSLGPRSKVNKVLGSDCELGVGSDDECGREG